jgi:CheY-like chemotaxis protein
LDVGIDSEKTGLIVDNQPREAAALPKQLAFAGFKTEFATTGAGAIQKVEEHTPDIVLLEASLSVLKWSLSFGATSGPTAFRL